MVLAALMVMFSGVARIWRKGAQGGHRRESPSGVHGQSPWWWGPRKIIVYQWRRQRGQGEASPPMGVRKDR